MKSHHGNLRSKRGGWFCHVRDESGNCQWAHCVRQANGDSLIFNVFPEDSDQIISKSDCLYGAGRGEWHYPGQCRFTELDLLKAAAQMALRARDIVGRARPSQPRLRKEMQRIADFCERSLPTMEIPKGSALVRQ
jgi:hypothetical protein